MKLHILEDLRFSCRSCSRCCRDLHVHVLDPELARLTALPWPAGHSLAGAKVAQSIGGKNYVRHVADGACMYLNPENQLCRIHEQFGAQAKPLGCQIFPFQLSASFDDEISVSGRYFCPTVRRNEGAAHVTRRAELTGYVAALGLRGGLTQEVLRGLSRQQVQALVRLMLATLRQIQASDERALLLYEMAGWLQQQPPELVSESAIRQALTEAREKAQASVRRHAGEKLPGVMKLAVRALLTVYLRRDDEVADKLVSPGRRMRAVASVILNRGSLSGLGRDHPTRPLRDVPLFTQPYELADDRAMDLFWDMVRVKLETMQFVGPANFHRDLVDGLRSLVLLQPLVVLAAKVHCASQGRGVSLTAQDVHYAVGVIEHAFGRQSLLNMQMTTFFERLLLRPDVLPCLLLAV